MYGSSRGICNHMPYTTYAGKYLDSGCLRDDTVEWLLENVGPKNWFTRDEPRPKNSMWQFYVNGQGMQVWFRNQDDAFKFRLVWG